MPPPVVAPRRRPLSTLNKPAPNRPKPKAKAAPPKTNCCDEPSIVSEGDSKVCVNCGTQISENNIVADVTFEEDARGAATVQGGFIGENARHARTIGSAAYRKIGGSERNSLQEIENNGRRALQALTPRLGIPQNVVDQAQALFGASARLNFSAGRRTDEVVAACLYIACKRQSDNAILLMDIAEVIKINVFRLGEVYKDLCKRLHYSQDQVGTGVQHLQDIEPLIQKYCRKLEFGPATRDVATDAVRILKRMNRDWITTGRHPAGLCGACIILAARMNNFKRSVREVVFVAKVCDMTIAKRVEEFRRTRASALTVEQFREYGTRLKEAHDPPVLHYSKMKKDKFEGQKRKREEDRLVREAGGVVENRPDRETIVIEDDGNSDDESVAGTPTAEDVNGEGERPSKRRRSADGSAQPPAQPPRVDADGFAIPALPRRASAADEQEEEVITPPKKRGPGRPRKKKPEPFVITDEELTIEEDLTHQIDTALHDDWINKMKDEAELAKQQEADAEAAALALANTTPALTAEQEAEKERAKEGEGAEGVTSGQERQASTDGEELPPYPEDEFANDPEVQNCMLSESESKIKEKIWVANNEDWLRAQHERDLIKKIAEAASADRAKNGKGKKTGPRKKRGRVGDGSVLEEADTPIETPADATNAMLKKRAGPGFSKYIDYESLARVYKKNPSPSDAGAQSRPGSEAPSAASQREGSATPSAHASAARDSVTPAPPTRIVDFALQTPQATHAASGTHPLNLPPGRASSPAEAPISPPATQAQTEAPAVTEEEGVDQHADEVEDYQSEVEDDAAPGGWDGDADDGEEFGGEADYDDEDFNRAVDPENFYDDDGGGEWE
ncbi:hypothetical protein LTR62_004173 [Meristemomyces frigidus]|uniref:Cyclin-like domain-containing protein n=1 Tax=Meristemomyces frigidus TaxID=1508187 RepID=A0AAN7TJH9_9PEZI|nr:hypothetical protein LTR62_004173 [Meristemomyces frigidus]